MHGEGDHHLNLNLLLGIQRMSRTGNDLELRPAKPFPVVRSIVVIGVRTKSTSCRGLGNKAMNEALNQVAKSPFTRRIEGAGLPRRFNQQNFFLYNDRIDPVEQVGVRALSRSFEHF